MSNNDEGLRLPEEGIAPVVRHPKPFLSEAWVRSLSYFRSSSRRIVQMPDKQQEGHPMMLTSCLLPNRPSKSPPSSGSAHHHHQHHQQPEEQHLSVANVRLDCPIIMGYLLKYSESEHNCENIRFLMDVDRLRDLMVLHMRPVWEEKHWRDLDNEVSILEEKGINNDSKYKRTLEMVSLLLLKESALATKNDPSNELLYRPHEHTTTTWSPEKKETWTPKNHQYDTFGLPLRSSNDGTPTDGDHDELTKTSLPSPSHHLWTPLVKTKSMPTETKKRDDFSRWLSGKDAIDREINRIWRTYLDVQAPCQVPTTDSVLERTKIRAKYFTLYGPEMFAEAMLAPMFCIQSDILYRFMKSKEYQKMSRFMLNSQPLPEGHRLEVISPIRCLFTINDLEFLSERRFTCREMVSDHLLYHQFLNYLSRRHSAQALLGVRLLSIFEEHMISKEWKQAEEIAWEIYRYYVAQGSAYEIHNDDFDRKEILRCLAKPKIQMFDSIKIVICAQLKGLFEKFRTTATYDGLHRLVVDSLQTKQRQDFIKTKNGCAGNKCA